MSYNRVDEVDRCFSEHVRAGGRPVWSHARPVPGDVLLSMFHSQMVSRHLDLAARRLRLEGKGYYTIASSGHEGNVVLGEVLRETDPAFLHYRSGAAMVQRARKRPDTDIIRDTLLGMMAAADDPTAGGRHKVWGSRPLWVPPQTSTIASHVPKAVGAAIAIDRATRIRLPLEIPPDSIVVCSFGDASVNHSTAQGAFNASAWMAYEQLPCPILFVCEDNGTGISVPTPHGWVEASMGRRPGIVYVDADGIDLRDAYQSALHAAELCRARRRPVFLHLRLTRLLGHAGSDIEHEYRTLEEIQRNEARDPLRLTADAVLAAGLRTPEQIVDEYEAIRQQVAEAAEDAVHRPRLETLTQVTAALAPLRPDAVEREARRTPDRPVNARPLRGRQRHLAALLNRGLHEMLAKYPESLIFGEDVARKGGVYNVTANLFKTYGPGRVFNTILDEQAILGLALGAAHLGFLPIPEIQYLAYLHNAEDQVRGEACSLQFFSNGQFSNPMVVRIASYAYQKGFGGHFHNDNSIAVLRDVPGLLIASPSRGDDAVRMLRTCMAAAKVDGRVVAFLEPIALYMTKDLHEENDDLWISDYPETGEAIAIGEIGVHDAEAEDLTIVSYANGLYLSLQAARRLARDGIRARVLDLRWLAPLNIEEVARHADETGRLLVVDECRRAGGLGEAIAAGVSERCGERVRIGIEAAADSYIPLGPAMNLCLPSADSIEAAARKLVVEPALQ